ncbi:MAG: GNAT family N-acetyltransferase [Gimesia sp.]|uniref:GNAT family N-acetyltransferase n=1 Tax=Gimesia maris TaxID=122 RepID=A0A3D3RC31_9PLAN|nr:GNAT family N-acetyltransferase [Gimesia sp.]HCO26424.1 GNAT family N-acetyltransferase [Gimesia maris]|tara:strand:+ start:65893 stop:66387 length:495 start_codon:yes stop_codon:yes gene_type:complete
MGFRVRQIELDDLAGFRAALQRVAAEKKYLLTVEPPSLENMEAYVRYNIEQNHAQYVAVVEQQIVGWADIIPHVRESVRHVARLGMGVLPEFRGQGIGNQLLERAMAHAWEQGLKRLELEVFADNEVALNLYRKHGYQVEGVKRFARCLDGVYQDIVIMGQYRA